MKRTLINSERGHDIEFQHSQASNNLPNSHIWMQLLISEGLFCEYKYTGLLHELLYDKYQCTILVFFACSEMINLLVRGDETQ